jgi:transposase
MMFDHYIAFDWAQSNVAVARMTPKSKKIQSFQTDPKVSELRIYLKSLQGTKVLTIEESTTAQWLYTEFREHVDQLIICDPRRNRLLSEGPKTDRIDAEKLVTLLRSDLLKPVFHSADQFIYLRKLVSGYEDLVKAGVRLKNQRSALFRATGQSKDGESLSGGTEQFVLAGIDRSIELYETEKDRYEEEFERLRQQHQMIGNLYSIPGFGNINAVKAAAIIVEPRRFRNKSHFLSYCGLVKLDRISGGKSYGKVNPQYNRTMKSVIKTATVAVLHDGSENIFSSYHRHLIENKRLADFNARNAVSRRIAVIAWGVLKSGKKLNRGQLKCSNPK